MIPTGKGDKSITLFLVICGLAALLYQFMSIENVTGGDLQDFGIGFGTIAAIWVGREWRKAHYDRPD